MIVDVFGGPGGWDEGAAELGMAPVGFEWDADACATRAAAGHATIRADLANYEMPDSADVEGIIGSPPCPLFSAAGNREGVQWLPHLCEVAAGISELSPDAPPEAALSLKPMEWVLRHRPRWFALEQVPDVVVLWGAVAARLRGEGYSTWTGVLNAANYGVPQTRQRAILIASRDQVALPPEPTHSRDPEPSLFGELAPWVDGMVVNFYRVLRDRHGELVDHLRLTPYGRDEYQWCKANYGNRGLDDLERARIFFTTVAQSFACTTGQASGWSASMKRSVHRARSTQYYVDRLDQIAARLQHVLIEHHTAAYVVEVHGDAADTVIYCDPPYVHSARTRTGGQGGGHGYAVEMTDQQHRDLAEVLHASPATVLLSGYHSDLYDELYDGWHRTTTETYSTVAGLADPDNNDTARTEVLWSNRPIFDGRLPL